MPKKQMGVVEAVHSMFDGFYKELQASYAPAKPKPKKKKRKVKKKK